jgi:hypothetical protein
MFRFNHRFTNKDLITYFIICSKIDIFILQSKEALLYLRIEG